MTRGREGKIPRAYILGDDPELNRDLTQDLTGAGWEVRCFAAFDGLAAAWEKASPTCVMVDAQWHSVDATAMFKLHQLYRERPRASRVPFVLMMDATDAASGSAAESGSVLRLPYRPADLVAVLTTVHAAAGPVSRRGRSRDAEPLQAPAVESRPAATPTAEGPVTASQTRHPGPATQPGPPKRGQAAPTDHLATGTTHTEAPAPSPALRVVGGMVEIPQTIAPLPVVAPDELPLQARPRRDPSRPVLVLIADEDSVVIDLLTYHSASAGWEVITAREGEAAEKMVRDRHPDIAVLGTNLPYRSGFDIVERLRDEAVAYDTRFVALSAQSQADNVLRAFDVGFSEFIGKPFDPAVVIGRLQRLVLDV